jgi:transcriptional regulator with XRE-family HTH domain
VLDAISAPTTTETHDADLPVERFRIELGEFLRSRRAELTPTAVGLPQTRRRRTPGLRREEVAELAGISTALYAWLEQARPVPVSRHTLDAIASALRLSADERLHLQNLGRPETPEIEECVSPALRRVMASLSGHAAYVLDHVWDIVLENAVAVAMFGASNTEGAERNLLKRVLTVDSTRSFFTDWEMAAIALIERFQFDFFAHAADSRMIGLAEELRANPVFDRVWSTHRVRRVNNAVLRFVHETAGALAFETTSYHVSESPGLRLLLFTPVDEETLQRVRDLCAAPRLADREPRPNATL